MMRINLVNRLLIFCVALTLLRYVITSQLSFLFLFWNLFLAWLPLFIVTRVRESDNPSRKHLLLAAAFAFLPNAPYIVTDLFHLRKESAAPIWLDVLLILAFAVPGLYYFTKASGKLLFSYGRLLVQPVIKWTMLVAVSYGIYLGRFLRFNSWDILCSPLSLLKGVIFSFTDPAQVSVMLPLTLCYAAFLYLMLEIYLSFSTKGLEHELS